MKKAEIKLIIELDDDHVPNHITWGASDFNGNESTITKAFMLSLWDEHQKNTLKIDLWTKKMSIDEMKVFFYQTLMTMGDSFLRSTGEQAIIEDLRDYCDHFKEKMKLDSLK